MAHHNDGENMQAKITFSVFYRKVRGGVYGQRHFTSFAYAKRFAEGLIDYHRTIDAVLAYSGDGVSDGTFRSGTLFAYRKGGTRKLAVDMDLILETQNYRLVL